MKVIYGELQTTCHSSWETHPTPTAQCRPLSPITSDLSAVGHAGPGYQPSPHGSHL